MARYKYSRLCSVAEDNITAKKSNYFFTDFGYSYDVDVKSNRNILSKVSDVYLSECKSKPKK